MGTLRKILIVDDEKFVTDTLEGFFHSKGYEIFKAEDGQACLKIIKSEKLDLVLLDIKLPKVDGIEVLKLLRRDHPEVKVIIMTAYDMEYKTMIDIIGCDAFFIKPLLIDELTGKVEELLSEKKFSGVGSSKTVNLAHLPDKPQIVLSEKNLPKARILIVSPRNLIADLLRSYFTNKEVSNGVFEVSESGLEQLEYIKKFKPEIILLDVALVGMLGEFGLTMMKFTQPPKEIILFGDPALKWEEAEMLIKRGTKFIEMKVDSPEKAPLGDTLQRLNNAVREVCIKYGLCLEGGS